MKHIVKFDAIEKTIAVTTGALLTEAARQAGIDIAQPCGGQGRCGRCAYREWCGGFRPRALGATGDPWNGDPGCYLTEEEISGAREAELKARYASA